MDTSRLLAVVSATTSLLRFFRRLGVIGLLLLSALDSSFLVLPLGNDLLLIALISSERSSLTWILYVLVSAVGSVLGVLAIDLLMRKTGDKGLQRFLNKRRIERLKTKIENKAGATVFVATLMPPPFPFTPVIMTASALQCPRARLLGAVFLGRLIRFSVEALLALYFGRRVIAYTNSESLGYIVYALIVVAVVASSWSLVSWLRRR